MPRRKLTEKNIRKITKTGGGHSFGITIPMEIVKEFRWKERQKVVVRKNGAKIIIEDWKK